MKTFTIVSNGYADGPSQALRDFLVQHKSARVTTIAHPLVPEGDNRHIVTRYENTKSTKTVLRLPHHPPFTYMFDSFVPLRLPTDTTWFGFNNLACLRGLLRRKFNRSEKVVYWAVDFVPDRFGKGFATRVYNAVDKFVCNNADVRVELSIEGKEGRDNYLGIDVKKAAPSVIIPMGAWLKRTPKVKNAAWSKKKIVYMGHLVERQGVEHAVRALALLLEEDPEITLEIVGSGPEEKKLKELSVQLGINKNNIMFHGFVKEHTEVERILANATVAVAPYAKLADSFTQTADPGKVKAYLGASLPMVLTDVPPIATEIERCGAGILVEDDPKSVAEAVTKYFDNENLWQKARIAAENKAQEFDWEKLLTDGLSEAKIL